MKKILISIMLLGFLTGCGCSSGANYKQILLEEHNTEYNDDNFFTALVTNDYEVVELFLQAGQDPDTESSTGLRVLYTAIGFDAIETIKLLIEYGADVDHVNDYGVNYIYFASINRQSCETINTLVDGGVDLYHVTDHGSTALDAATGQLQYTPEYKVQVDCLKELGLTE